MIEPRAGQQKDALQWTSAWLLLSEIPCLIFSAGFFNFFNGLVPAEGFFSHFKRQAEVASQGDAEETEWRRADEGKRDKTRV